MKTILKLLGTHIYFIGFCFGYKVKICAEKVKKGFIKSFFDKNMKKLREKRGKK